MVVAIARSDAEIMACYPVLRELRPQLLEPEFLQRVRRQEEGGYRLAYVAEAGVPVGVAGFRLGENLAWGRFLYVDDLVVLPQLRSAGHGKTLLDWLAERARAEGCVQLHLDSGLQRTDAHRFYQREGMLISSYHFQRGLG